MFIQVNDRGAVAWIEARFFCGFFFVEIAPVCYDAFRVRRHGTMPAFCRGF
jgi:hypothetical protein